MAFKMTPGIKSPKMKAGNGLPSDMMMKPCGGPMMTPPKGTPLNAEGDKKKVKYDPTGIAILGKPINTYESDKAQLAKPIEKVGKGLQKFFNSRSQGRIDAYNAAGGISPSVKATTPKVDSPEEKAGRSGMADDTKARKNKTGIYKPKAGASKSFKSAYDKRDKKVYGNLSQSQFTAESKRQIASKKAGKGYDAPKKQMGKVRKKVEAVKSMKAAGSDVKRQTPKLAGDVRTKAQKLRAKGENVVPRKTKLKNKEVKSTKLSKRTERTRAKGEAALASGDKKKALRLRRRVDRQEARGAKKEVRGAKREARKTNKVIKPKKVDQVVKPKKTVEIEKSKEKKKKTSRSGIMI